MVGQLLHVQNSDFDAALGEEEDYVLSYAIASTRDDDDLAIPVIFVAAEIVRDLRVEPVAECVRDTQSDQGLEVLERGRMFAGDDIALGRVARKE